jgi:hypothetical protein
VTVFLIEAEQLGFGLMLSPPVAAAAQRVIGELQEMIQAYPRPEPARSEQSPFPSRILELKGPQ